MVIEVFIEEWLWRERGEGVWEVDEVGTRSSVWK